MAQETATKMQSTVDEPLEEALRREPTDEKIRQRAYEIYLARDCALGHELDDWLQAERELRSNE